MIGKFNADPEMMRVENTLKNHEPLVFVTISTTGIDAGTKKEGFTEHEPTRATVIEYAYNENEQRYVQNLVFDEFVKCSKKALAETAKSSFDVFSEGGVSKNDYVNGVVNGKEVLEKRIFDAKLSDFLESIEGGILVTNNCDFIKHYLKKSAPKATKIIEAHDSRHTFLDVRNIAASVYDERNMSLKKINEKINGVGTIMAKGAAPKIEVMSRFVQKIGRDNGFLNSVRQDNFNAAYAEEKRVLSERGKEKYQDSSNAEKLEFWKSQGIVNIDTIVNRNGKCDLNNLYDIFDGKSKGFIIMQAATTGFDAGNEIIQLTLRSYTLQPDGSFKPFKGFTKDIMASKRNVEKARELAANGGFDAFKFAGIDAEKYAEGVGLLTPETLIKRISKFFEECPPSDYPIITMGKSRDGKHGFTQDVLMKHGNVAGLNAPFIEFSQVLKEYACLVDSGKQLKINAIIPPDAKVRSYGLETIAKLNGIDDLNGTKKRCNAAVMLMAALSEQYRNEYGRNLEQKTAVPTKEEPSGLTEELYAPSDTAPINKLNNAVTKSTPAPAEKPYSSDELDELLARFKREQSRTREQMEYTSTDIPDYQADLEKAEESIVQTEPVTSYPDIDDEYKNFFMEEEPVPEYLEPESDYEDEVPNETFAEYTSGMTDIEETVEEETDSEQDFVIENDNDYVLDSEPESEDEFEEADLLSQLSGAEMIEEALEEESFVPEPYEEETPVIDEAEAFEESESFTAIAEPVIHGDTEYANDDDEEFDLFANLQNADREIEEPVKEEIVDEPAQGKVLRTRTEEPQEENTEPQTALGGASEMFAVLNTLAASVTALDKKMDGIAAQMETIQTNLTEISLKQSETDDKIAHLSSTLSQIGEIDRNIIQALINNETQVNDMKNNINILRNDTNKLRTEQTASNTQLANIVSLLEKGKRMQKQIEQ